MQSCACKFVNLWLRYKSFTYEQLQDALDMISPGEYLWSTDLQSGYHQLPMHPDAFPFLGACIGGQIFVMTCLPFGIASACRIYTLVMAALYRPLRQSGQRLSYIIDDALGAAHQHLQG